MFCDLNKAAWLKGGPEREDDDVDDFCHELEIGRFQLDFEESAPADLFEQVVQYPSKNLRTLSQNLSCSR